MLDATNCNHKKFDSHDRKLIREINKEDIFNPLIEERRQKKIMKNKKEKKMSVKKIKEMVKRWLIGSGADHELDEETEVKINNMNELIKNQSYKNWKKCLDTFPVYRDLFIEKILTRI